MVWEAVKGWLTGRKRVPVMELGGERVPLSDPVRFDDFLSERVRLGPSERRRLRDADAQTTGNALDRVRRLHGQILRALVRCADTRTPLQNVWAELDFNDVPDDQDWQDLLFAIGNRGHLPHEIRRILLCRFVEYLEARQQFLLERVAILGSAGESALDSLGTGEMEPLTERASRPGFVRLPYNRGIDVETGAGTEIILRLASCRLTLYCGDAWWLIESDGTRHQLADGPNLVGRSRECDVPLGPGVADVSRRHAVIEVVGAGRLRVTDLSTRGTWLPRDVFVSVVPVRQQ